MKIFTAIQWGKSGAACGQCAHFQNDPSFIEQAFRGLTTMSSGFASVRDRDGICALHQRYLSASDRCADFSPVAASRVVLVKGQKNNP
jgi:hypothetical protein